jgi:hypothetical protein
MLEVADVLPHPPLYPYVTCVDYAISPAIVGR